MQKYVVANWKMNGSRNLFDQYLNNFNEADNIIVCPPFIYLNTSAKIHLGAQNIFHEPKGAFTGELSTQMLNDVGVKYCLVGHSERRQHFAETNNMVRLKAQACLDASITPIICIGETLAEHEANLTNSVLQKQLDECLPSNGAFWLAYEPIWAIGTGKTPTIDEIHSVHLMVREKLPQTKLLYGGSVDPTNAKSIFAVTNVDGVLVGGASLDIQKIKVIYDAARANA